MVKINTDAPEEIVKLYGIGDGLAEAIVRHREEHGHFEGPDDLAQVEGIGLDLATTLAPHIDWQVPTKPKPPSRRQWAVWLLVLVLFGHALRLVTLLVRTSVPELHAAVLTYEAASHCSSVDIWRNASIVTVYGCGAIAFFTLAATALTRAESLAGQLARTFVLLITCMFAAWMSTLLSRSVYAHMCSSVEWVRVLQSSVGLAAITVLALPFLIALLRPEMLYSPRLARAYEIIIVFGSSWQVLWLGLFGPSGPLVGPFVWTPLQVAGFGFVQVVAGIYMILTRDSIFSLFVTVVLGPLSRVSSREDASGLLRWLNVQLPDPQKQKALKQALDKAYPPSRTRAVIGVIVFGAGGWLLLTLLQAIIEWFIQGWLGQALPQFFQ